MRQHDNVPETAVASATYDHVATFSKGHTDNGQKATRIHFRLIRIDDEERLRAFFRSHTEDTIYLRYGMMVGEMSHERALELVRLDGHKELAMIGLAGPEHNEHIVAVGRYYWEETTNLAEVAFVVHEQYRDMGIATHLLQALVNIVRDQGFAGITAQLLACNTSMLRVFRDVLGCAEEISYGGEMTLVYRFPKPEA